MRHSPSTRKWTMNRTLGDTYICIHMYTHNYRGSIYIYSYEKMSGFGRFLFLLLGGCVGFWDVSPEALNLKT